VELKEPWAVRERSVVVQKLDALPQYARELVDFICEAGRQAGAAGPKSATPTEPAAPA
jgi:hypothetical protein